MQTVLKIREAEKRAKLINIIEPSGFVPLFDVDPSQDGAAFDVQLAEDLHDLLIQVSPFTAAAIQSGSRAEGEFFKGLNKILVSEAVHQLVAALATRVDDAVFLSVLTRIVKTAGDAVLNKAKVDPALVRANRELLDGWPELTSNLRAELGPRKKPIIHKDGGLLTPFVEDWIEKILMAKRKFEFVNKMRRVLGEQKSARCADWDQNNYLLHVNTVLLKTFPWEDSELARLDPLEHGGNLSTWEDSVIEGMKKKFPCPVSHAFLSTLGKTDGRIWQRVRDCVRRRLRPRAKRRPSNKFDR